MDLTPHLELAVLNAWIGCVPLLVNGALVSILRPAVAKRMADMTGYTRSERLAAIVASLMPYPFMVLSIWTPFSRVLPLVAAGLLVYASGLVVLVSAGVVFYRTPLDRRITGGPYELSRHPIYVSASLMFIGLGVATQGVLLLGLAIVSLYPQHLMILAEERVCNERFGGEYDAYRRRVSRYLPGL